MPTETEYLGITLTNIGPLTTTFTAAASCATASNYVWLESMTSINAFYYRFLGQPTCAIATFDGCIPSGKAHDAVSEKLSSTPFNGYAIYQSPGLVCPSGWTTAGSIVGGGGPSSGIFTVNATVSAMQAGYPNGPTVPPLIDAYVKPMEDEETMVWCCPSGFKADVEGICSSTLGPPSNYSYSEVCWAEGGLGSIKTVTEYKGTPLPHPAAIISGTYTSRIYTTEAITETRPGHVAFMTGAPAIAMYHKESDKTQAPKSGGGNDDEDSGATSSGPSVLGLVSSVLVAALAGIALMA